MREIGISIYPNRENISRILEYIKLSSKYGFTRIFTCLISTDDSKEEVKNFYKKITETASLNNMKVIADVSPSVMDKFNISYQDLSFFDEIGFYGIRLDLGFSGIEESIMSFDKSRLKIELNMSNGTKYIDNILSYMPNTDSIIGCHNFYPHKYTGLSRKHFIKTSRQFKELGIRTAAFVSSKTALEGPWPVNEGLCTLEEHRVLDIDIAVKDLFNTNLIDDVIIANQFACEQELKKVGNISANILSLTVTPSKENSEIENKIIFDEFHFNRGDVSEYLIRSTQSRVKYRSKEFKAHTNIDIKKGDILIESSLYKRYKGELQIALKDMKNSGKTNVVGKIKAEEIYLLDSILPWQKFKFNK
ncbi:DUF871 domain-containing protein [Helicovermis profundi]|uniref:MupG family TIM beta-alpha barrel fold protein n=1 Tax=Helicovermis profundi TaxID=3065157 RepID=A0AAU9EQT5_9FIRM|nr:MupG family TIM beta-alpha barrel fold protein [Clostridia bacterium S502]